MQQQRKTFLAFALIRMCITKEQNKVPQELQKAIDQCVTLMELRDLLFSTKQEDEAILNAFDKRFNELLEAKRI